MSRKALKVVVELKLRAVSCPGVHLSVKDDIFLSVCVMGQYRQSESLPAVFPLLLHEKMTFEKIFRHAVDPGDIAAMLEYEMIRIDLVQLIPPGGDTLACFEEDARRFLFPEPKLIPSFSGVDREVLMIRAPHFPGIAPRLEFSSKTTIIECSADAQISFYPNVLLRPMMKRSRKPSSRPRTSFPQRRRSVKTNRDRFSRSPSHLSRSQSMSPLRAENLKHQTRLSLDSAAQDNQDSWGSTSSSEPLVSSWPGVGRSVSSPLTHSTSTVMFTPAGRRKSMSNGLVVQSRGALMEKALSSLVLSLDFGTTRRPSPEDLRLQVGGTSEEESSSSETQDPSGLWRSYREQTRSRSSHREWEVVQERVRGLLTTPRAVRRLVYGATHSEVDEVLSRRSISPGPP